jgi:gliding motility-associated-like protein
MFGRLIGYNKANAQCSDTTLPFKILINEIPDATISIFPDPAKLCVGDPKSIEVTFQGSKGLQPYRFDYKLDGALKDTASASIPGVGKVLFPFNTINPIEDSTFILDSITDKNGCTAKFTGKTVKLEVIPLPQLDFQADKTIGCYPLEVIFTDKSAVLNTDVVWDFGNGDLDYSSLGVVKYVFQKSGDYTINFKSTIDGCWDTIQKTNYIRVKDRPEAKFSPKKTNLSLIDPEIQFINSSSSNSIYYKWVFGDGSPVSNLENPKHIYIGDGSNGLPNPGKYTVELYAYINQDCWDSTSTIITIDDEQIYYIPNTFTPNGDEKNNTFQPIFTSGFDAQNYHFLIYNRWGELIFESNNPAIGWDGTYGDKLLGNDSYTWKLQFKEKMTEKEHYLTGHVNLLK